MTKRFDFIYEIITAVTSVILVISLTAAANSNVLSVIIDYFSKSNSTPIYAQENINRIFKEKEPEIETADRTVYAVNPLDLLTKTPEDIMLLINSAKENSVKDIQDGKIVEKHYEESSVTEKIGNILVRNNTDTQQELNLKSFFDAKPEIKITDKSKPAVLIFHTHTTESYELIDREWYAQDYITRSNSSDRNMVRVGIEIKEQLEAAGYRVIHDTEIHDTKYTGAYAHSRKSVEKALKENPEIQIVLDIHRDAIELDNGTRIKPVATVLGKKAAQMMIITGCEEGKVTDFPDWQKNLTFALELQSICEEMYPGVMRPVYFCQRKYNMDLSHNNLLVEMGSCANTLEEAAYSGRLLGSALVKMLDSAQI